MLTTHYQVLKNVFIISCWFSLIRPFRISGAAFLFSPEVGSPRKLERLKEEFMLVKYYVKTINIANGIMKEKTTKPIAKLLPLFMLLSDLKSVE